MADYIKKQDVIEYLNEECEAGCVDPFTDHHRRECFREAVECIESIETVDAEPVRHGRWKGEGMGDYSCILCGEVVSARDYRYCPYCGAKMDPIEER